MASSESRSPGRIGRLEIILSSLPVALVLGLGTAVPGVIAGTTHGRAKVAFIIILALCALLNGLGAWTRQRQAGTYRALAQRAARTVAGAGQPVVITLGELCLATSPDETGKKLAQLQERVLQTARTMCGLPDHSSNRAVFYTLSDDGSRLEDPIYIGRDHDEPREEFLDSDHRDRAVIEFAQRRTADRVDLVNDVLKAQTRGSLDHQRATYRSYVSVPVAIGKHSYGLLTVDSPIPGNFAETDKGSMLLLAGALAAGLAQRKG